jgi:protease-4
VSLASDEIVDRRRLRRSLIVWRTAAAVLAIAIAAFVIGEYSGRGDYVARLQISGVITRDAALTATIRKIAKDNNARAVLVDINSPGGTVVGGEELFLELRALADRKPVAALIGTLGTSAAYMAALGTDRIFSRQGSMTGSIGVILQTTEISGLLESLGITTESVKSGPLKAVPSPFEPMSPEGREATRAVIMDVFDMFVDLVAERRSLGREEALRLADGRVYTGRQAVGLGLVDEIGGDKEARAWLATERGISLKLPVRDLDPPREFSPWRSLVSLVSQKTVFSETLTLDGLVSLWHPELR